MVELKFLGKPEEIRAEIMQFFGWNVVGATAPAPTPAQTALPPQVTAEVEPAKEKPKKTEKVEKAESKPAPAQPATTATPAVPTVDPLFGQMQASLAKLMKEKGRDAVLALFKKFGATRGSEIKPSDYQAVIDTIAAGIA